MATHLKASVILSRVSSCPDDDRKQAVNHIAGQAQLKAHLGSFVIMLSAIVWCSVDL